MQSNLTSKIVDIMRKASKALIRDFYEVDKLKSSTNILQFVDTACSRTEKILHNEFHSAQFKSLLPENYSWLIIPIEGKINFLHGIPYFCIVVTLFVDGLPTTTVIDSPIFKETYCAERGIGLNMQDLANIFKLRVGRTNSAKYAFICANSPMDLGVGYFRSLGSNFLSLVNVAAGKFDACIFKVATENREQIVATVNLIMSESKGKVSIKGDYILASNLELHQELYTKIPKQI